MHSGKVKSRADTLLRHQLHEPVAVAAEPVGFNSDDKEMPGVAACSCRLAEGLHAVDPRQLRTIELSEAGPALDKTVQLSELVDAEGRLQVGETILPTRCHCFVARGIDVAIAAPGVAVDAVESQQAKLLRQLVAVGGRSCRLRPW